MEIVFIQNRWIGQVLWRGLQPEGVGRSTVAPLATKTHRLKPAPLAFCFLGGFLRGFFFQVGDGFLYFRGVCCMRENSEIFIVGFNGLGILVLLFVSLA
jgi:hypothetical protein